jgi:hypothetical protein
VTDLIGANGAALVAAIPKRVRRAATGLNWLQLAAGEELLGLACACEQRQNVTPILVIFAVEKFSDDLAKFAFG